MREALLRFNDGLYRACIWISGIAIAVMALIIPWGIFTRYVLGTGSQWPEPIAIQLMVLFTFLGAAAAYRANGHIAVQLVTARLPAAARRLLGSAMHVAVLVVAVFALVYGTRLCMATWNQVIGQLPWLRVGITYAPVPVGGLLTLLFVVEALAFGSQAERAAMDSDLDAPAVKED
ncbi:MAG: TRAP transporter small permease [Anaerolineae bacterium]|nr:TRAP transporter small permease [Anaerolineae bacterium]